MSEKNDEMHRLGFVRRPNLRAAMHQMHRLGFVPLPNLHTADGVIYGAKSPIGTYILPQPTPISDFDQTLI